MQPSPGRIHSLPIKVLYSLDTSSQSYLTILNERQDVFVHPREPSASMSAGEGSSLGSCCLKGVAWGICFASPECVPSPNTHDFSIYNLDPVLRSRSARPFTSNNNAGSSHPPSPSSSSTPTTESWQGKGFLSWTLAEPNKGERLVRGRLIREYEFAMQNFDDVCGNGGGLEGLMAAANANASAGQQHHAGRASRNGTTGNSNGNGGNGDDGKSWGLEVVMCLKEVPWSAAGGLGGREQFEEMLSKGRAGFLGAGVGAAGGVTPGSANGMSAGSIVGQNQSIGNGQALRTDLNSQQTSSSSTTGSSRPIPRPVQQPPRTSGTSATTATTAIQVINRPGTATLSSNAQASSSRQNSISMSSIPQRPSSAASIRSQSGLPPSSIPMHPSSSAQGSSRPSPVPEQQNQRQSSLPPSAMSHINGKPMVRNNSNRPPSSSGTPQNHNHNQDGRYQQGDPTPTQASITSTNTNTNTSTNQQRDRETTPPPRPQPKSPPPSTPSRATLQALLQSDSKMSPGLAKQLASNPTLLKLLKSVPQSAVNNAHASSSNANNLLANGNHQGNPFAVGLGASQQGQGQSQNAGNDIKPSPAMSDIPTPASGVIIRTDGEGCNNCGTTETDVWRIKKLKDGTEMKVCNACGMYFNRYKRMRPSELWDEPKSTPAVSQSQVEKKPKLEDSISTSNGSSNQPQIPIQKTPPVRSSPRLHRTHDRLPSSSTSFAQPPLIQESPRKRKRGNINPPQPSPRRATRAAIKEGLVAIDFPSLDNHGNIQISNNTNTNTPGGSSSMFLTSPVNSTDNLSNNHIANGNGNGNGNDQGTTQPDFDLEALLAQFVENNNHNHNHHNNGNNNDGSNGGNGNGTGNSGEMIFDGLNGSNGDGGVDMNIDLQALFGDVQMSQEMLDLLSGSWDTNGNLNGDMNDQQQGGVESHSVGTTDNSGGQA